MQASLPCCLRSLQLDASAFPLYASHPLGQPRQPLALQLVQLKAAEQVVQVPLIMMLPRLVQRVHWVALVHWAQPALQGEQPPVELRK